MFNTTQDWFFALVLVFMGLTAISWLVFGQLSMQRMEMEMKADGLPNCFAWDGVL